MSSEASSPGPLADCAKDGAFVILWGSYTQVFGVVLKQGSITNNRFGNFHHDDLIGQPFGGKVRSRKGGAWLALLRPTSELVTQSLTHRTQIIYHADISMLRCLLDARPGRIICEAGTGSGSVSASLARALYPGGQLNTFEFHEDRQKQAAADFEKYGVSGVVVSRHRDVCNEGFGENLRGVVHGVFLDLPAPWSAIRHVDDCLLPGGRIVTFSPCIEQIDKTATELRRGGRYHDVRLLETLAVNWGVRALEVKSKKRKAAEETPAEAKEETALAASPAGDAPSGANGAGQWMSYQMPMRSHTGYLLVATKAPAGEPQATKAPVGAPEEVLKK